MDDLTAKFFREDLTEAEDQILQDLLLNSDEDAARFDEQARARYERYGLPEPRWPGDPESNGLRLTLMRWTHGALLTLVWILAAAILGVIGFMIWRAQNNAAPPDLSPAPSTAGPTAGPFSTGHSAAAPRTASSLNVQGLPWTPLLTPIDAARNPGRTYSNLAVTVHKASAGPVTVRVLTLEGAPLALLYQGGLSAGTWIFDWDGKRQDGRDAASGYYEIQMESDSGVEKKVIQIH